MITIALHQLREGLRDAKFLFLAVIVLVAFAVNGVVFSQRYELDLADYQDAVRTTTDMLSSQAGSLQDLSNYNQVMVKPPAALAFVYDGGEGKLPNTLTVNAFIYRNPRLLSRGNEMLSTLPPLDWSFIVGALLTLTSLLVSYSAICGEKRDGTLKLLLSYPVSRRALFAGKFLGLLAVVLSVFILGVLINFGIIIMFGSIPLGLGLLLPLSWILLISVLTLTFTMLTGMAVSSFTARPAVALVILLVLWVLMVAAVPGIARLIAEQTTAVRSNFEVEREMEQAVREVSNNHPDEAGNWNGDPFAPNIPLRKAWVIDQLQTQQRFEDAAFDARFRQAEAVRDLAALSPVGLFSASCESICNTGVTGVRELWRNSRRYQEQLHSFTVERDRIDPDTPHLVYSWGSSSDRGVFSTKPVDMSTVPRSHVLWGVGGLPRNPPMPLAQAGILALLTLLVAGIAFIGVSRSDPR